MIVNQTPYPISFEMKTAQALTCRYGEVGRQYKFIADIDLTGLSANLQVIKPDGTFVIEEATVTVTEDKQYIVVEIPLQATVVKGVCRYDINLFQDEDLILYTAEGPLWVDDQLVTEDMIESVAEVYSLRFPQDFLTVENLVDIVNYVKAQIINDEAIAEDTTWSSQKIEQEISGITPEITGTAEGNPIEITDAAAAPMVKCVTEIQGSQDLHGYDKPWVGGAGKNKLHLILTTLQAANTEGTWNADGTYTVYQVTWSIIYDDMGQITSIKASGQASAVSSFIIPLSFDADTMIVNGCPANGSESTYYVVAGTVSTRTATDTGTGATINGTTSRVVLRVATGFNAQNIVFYPMLRTSGDSTFAPYSNICPITAYTEGEIEVSDGDGNVTTHTTTYPSAIYRGSEDVVNGSVTANKVKLVFDGTESWSVSGTRKFYLDYAVTDIKEDPFVITNEYPYSGDVKNSGSTSVTIDHSVYVQSGSAKRIWVYDTSFSTVSDFTTWLSTHNLEVVYELATPTTSSVTPTNLPIKSLSGYTHIESSTGDMEVEYLTQTYDPIAELINISSLHVYSTEEKIVGKWIDGKDLYEITFSLNTNMNSGSYSQLDLSSLNIDKFVSAEGVYNRVVSSLVFWYKFGGYEGSSYYSNIRYDLSSKTLDYIVGYGQSESCNEQIITIRYTKTS